MHCSNNEWEVAAVWLEDALFTGGGLPFAFAVSTLWRGESVDQGTPSGWLAATMVGLGLALGGTVLFQSVSQSPPPPQQKNVVDRGSQRCVRILHALTCIFVDTSLVLLQADRLDPDLGASLCVIPVFALACLSGSDSIIGCMRMVVAAASVIHGVMGMVWFLAFSSNEVRDHVAIASPSSNVALCAALCVHAAYALNSIQWSSCATCLRGPEAYQTTWIGVVVRVGLLLGLFFGRWLSAQLLTTALPGILFYLQLVAAIYSITLKAARIKAHLHALTVVDAQRTTMLLVVVSQLLAYHFQWRIGGGLWPPLITVLAFFGVALVDSVVMSLDDWLLTMLNSPIDTVDP